LLYISVEDAAGYLPAAFLFARTFDGGKIPPPAAADNRVSLAPSVI